MTRDPRDRRVIACNYSEGTKTCKKGARAYLVQTNPGGGHDRIVILARSRGGRWIEKWEDIRRLKGFRLTTIPSAHPLYHSTRIQDGDPRTVALLERARAHLVDGADPNAVLRWERAGYECAEYIDFIHHRPPVVRISAFGAPTVAVCYGLQDYYQLGDDAAFAGILEHMLELAREGAFG